VNRVYFGTDGVRGVFGGPVINPAFAARLGEAVGRWVQAGRGPGTGGMPPIVLIGRDPRESGPVLAAALAAGLRAAGCAPQSLGILPTPAVARAVRRQGAAVGVVVTASHNPAADNGIKFFGPDGRKLTDEQEAAIEAALPAQTPPASAASGPEPGTGAGATAADYVAAAEALLPPGALRGWRIALDTANGATAATSPAVLRALGADLAVLGAEPDGRNINAGVGSEHPEALAARVRQTGARLGIAHDGDGDRCILCDERGDLLDGDEMLTILATHALAAGRLAAGTLVVTVHSNLGVDAAVAQAGGRVVRTAVGDRYVVEGMAAAGATLGGESSGHLIFSELSPTGDGLVAALKVIEVMLETGQPLSVLRRVLRKFPQASASLAVRVKRPLAELARLTATIRDLEAELGAQGRVLVRYSGTEPKLRLLVEGPEEAPVTAGLARLEAAARAELG
jgi:phosphoglucosamine mutase